MSQEMFPSVNLYELYTGHIEEEDFSSAIPDVTKQRTLESMQVAVRCAEDWNAALDIGGGTGHYSIPLLHIFSKVTLVEPDLLDEHAILEKRYENFTVLHDFIEDAIIPEKQDFILLADIFEHVPDVESFIAKLATLQNSGGVIYILTPNPLCCGPSVRSGISCAISGSHGHIRHYFKHEVEDILTKSGYLLVHHSFEEAPLRTRVRTWIRGISRRDKRWSRNCIYRFVSPIVHTLLKPLIIFLARVVYQNEYAHRHDAEHSKASVYIFKKR